MPDYLPVTVCGIPATCRIDGFVSVKPWKGSAQTCPSSADYYGYNDLDFTICDRRGRPAPWLKRKAETTSGEYKRVEAELISQLLESEEY